jgi:hypothetical protein
MMASPIVVVCCATLALPQIETSCFKAFLPPLLLSSITISLHLWKLHRHPLPFLFPLGGFCVDKYGEEFVHD